LIQKYGQIIAEDDDDDCGGNGGEKVGELGSNPGIP
jgi:hypothetical protein